MNSSIFSKWEQSNHQHLHHLSSGQFSAPWLRSFNGRASQRRGLGSKADRKTTFFGYQHSLKDIIMWEAILNHMVPLMTIYSQPIRPQFDLNKCGRGDSNSRDEWSITFSILVVVQILVALPLLNRPCCVDYFFDGPCSSYIYRDIIYCSKRLISVIL